MSRACRGGESREGTHFCLPGVLNSCPQSRQINMLSERVYKVAGDFAAKEGVVTADEPDSVALVAVDTKLKSVLAELGVDLLDCGLDVLSGFCNGDVLGISLR